jgi:hypothetical protein
MRAGRNAGRASRSARGALLQHYDVLICLTSIVPPFPSKHV